MYISDSPIKKPGQDVLRRVSFSDNFGKSLIDWSDDTSIVVGLYGKWGSGKSSIINLASEYIAGIYKKGSAKNKPIIVYFNPWNFSEQEKLVSAFLHELAKSISHFDPSEDAKKVGKELVAYSHLFTEALRIPLELAVSVSPYAPILLPVVKFIGKVFRDSGEATKAWGELKEKTVEQYKDDLSKHIKKLGRKIIVIIDDIDRLNNKEVRQIFQLVKQNANFPGFLYVLPFDRNKVAKILDDDSFPGAEYIEKIVQIPFDVPVVEQVKLDRILFNEINRLIKPFPQSIWDDKNWGNVYYGGLQKFFSSIRQIKRYINSLEFNLTHIPDEVNPVDFMVLEALRIFVPEVYQAIWKNKRVFTELESNYVGSGGRNTETRKQKIKEITDLAGEFYKETVVEVLGRLFPQTTSGYTVDWLEEWNKKKRICSEERFDRYFLLEIPENEVSQREIDDIVKISSSPQSVEKKILALRKDNKAKNFLEKLVMYRDEVPEKDILSFVLGVYNAGSRLPNERSGMAILDTISWCVRVGYQLFKRIKTSDERLVLILELINRTKGLEGVANLVSIEVRRDKKESSDHEYLLEEKDLSKVREAMVGKIKKFSKSKKLLKVSNLAYILCFWENLSNINEVKKYVERVTKTDKGLNSFIEGFMWSQTSQTMGDYVSVNTRKVNIESMGKFIDPKALKSRVEKIVRSKKRFTENQSLALKLFLEAFNSKKDD